MKKSMFALALAVLCTLPAAARAQGLGILGGFSYGSVPSTGPSLGADLKANSGYAVGLSVESGGVVGFGINGLYAQRGYTSSTPGGSLKLNYVDVPVYLRVAIPNPVVTPFGFVGPQASFQVDCQTGIGSCQNADKTTFAGVLGVGVRLSMLGSLSVQGRYIYGLTDLKYTTVSTQQSYKDRSFMLLLGLSF